MDVANNYSDHLYIITLRVTQPARVQDIYASLPKVFGDEVFEKVKKEDIYASHKKMLDLKLIYKIRKGTYCLSPRAWGYARTLIKQHKLDNKRFFLLKSERRAYH